MCARVNLRSLAMVAIFALGFVFATASRANAAPSPEAAQELIKGMASDAISTLSAANSDQNQIKTKFHEILAKNFDLNGIAKFVLGRYWRITTPEQQDEYTHLFENYIVGIYANRFSQYSGETVSVESARQDQDATIVSSHINLTKGNQPVLVEWKVIDGSNGAPVVSDVIIENVSMSLTQRSEFSTLIQNNGGKIESLLAQLRSRIK